jgi:hypothetical protein
MGRRGRKKTRKHGASNVRNANVRLNNSYRGAQGEVEINAKERIAQLSIS